MTLAPTLMVAQASAILEQAVALPAGHGLLIRCGVIGHLPRPALRARDQLSRVRKEMSPVYDQLMFLLGRYDPDHEIVIVRRTPA